MKGVAEWGKGELVCFLGPLENFDSIPNFYKEGIYFFSHGYLSNKKVIMRFPAVTVCHLYFHVMLSGVI